MLDDVALSGVDVKRDPKAPEVRKAEIPDAGADCSSTKVMDRARPAWLPPTTITSLREPITVCCQSVTSKLNIIPLSVCSAM